MSALAPLLAVYTLLNATTYSVVSSPSLASPPPYSSLHIVAGESPDAVATGSATDLSQSLGFTRLSITTPVAAAEEENVDVLTSTMGVGFLEGALTVNQTWVFMQEFAMYEIYPLLAKTSVYTYFETQYRYLRAQVDAHGSSSAYWERVGLLLAQLEGLVAGFNYAIGDQKYFIDVPRAIIINALPEFPEIVASLGKSRKAVFGGSPVLLSWMERVVDKLPHCSALVKPTPDGNDLLTSHVTWSSYTLMGVRLIKNISFPGADAATVAFTSMPMYVWSVDDFYVTSHDLVVMETTNDIYNKSLYKYVRPEGTVCTFLRAAMAVRYATSGKEWCDIFTPYNSGTYCNQWIVTDKTNSLHILEQIPGLIVAKDMTDVMHKQTYWPSYNVPYFPQIYNLSGYTESYEECPRAQIFRRDQHTVTDLESLKHFMRSNDYKHDPLSHGNPSWAISSRFDLLPPDRQGEPFGAIDAKVTSAALRATQPLRFQAVFGPTHQSIPPFKWDASEYWYFPHANQLNEWNQTWTG